MAVPRPVIPIANRPRLSLAHTLRRRWQHHARLPPICRLTFTCDLRLRMAFHRPRACRYRTCSLIISSRSPASASRPAGGTATQAAFPGMAPSRASKASSPTSKGRAYASVRSVRKAAKLVSARRAGARALNHSRLCLAARAPRCRVCPPRTAIATTEDLPRLLMAMVTPTQGLPPPGKAPSPSPTPILARAPSPSLNSQRISSVQRAPASASH